MPADVAPRAAAMSLSDEELARLEAWLRGRATIGAPDDCWEWQRGRTVAGYGTARFGGKQTVASRAVWALLYGPIREGAYICHHCDNPPCVNPAHLFLGTPSDNVQDMIRKGRMNCVKTDASRASARSLMRAMRARQRRPLNARLTDEQVAAILADSRSQDAIAADYGVAQTTISLIKRRLTWRDVTATAEPAAAEEDR